MPERLKFTKRALEALPPAPAGGRATYHDTECNGLTLRVTDAGAKSFILQRRINGKPERVTLGRFPEMTIEQARKAAAGAHVKINDGTSPNAVKRAERARAATLADVLDAYLLARPSRPNTVAAYRRAVDLRLADWCRRPFTEISRDMVRERHREISKDSATAANTTMRVLRALLTYAQGEYRDENGGPLLLENPVGVLSHHRAWNREQARDGAVQAHQLRDWWQATAELEETPRDYLRLVLLTGLRRREAACIAWSDVDLKARTLRVPTTKNGKPLVLPLSSWLVDMLHTRRAHSEGAAFVFASPTSESGHIEEPKKATAAVAKRSGVQASVHDLRRSFALAADMAGVGSYALKGMLNHSSAGDVTAVNYLPLHVERLREPMEKVAAFILRAAGVLPGADVLPFPLDSARDTA